MAELNKNKTSGSKKLRSKRATENKSATAMNEIKEQLAVKAAIPEKVYKDTKSNKSMVFDHTRYVEVLKWVKDGLSSSEVIIKISEEYGYTLSSASTFFYQILKYWRNLFKQEDVDLLRYTLREKYENIVQEAIARGDLKEARSTLDSIRRMFGLDKQEVEVVNKEIKFKFEGVPELTTKVEDVEDNDNDFIEDNDEVI